MQEKRSQGHSRPEGNLERPRASRLIAEVRKERRQALRELDPGQKMQAAFLLSANVRKLLIAGLKAQGFTQSEISAILRARRR
jgi:hypothetical protein